MKKGLRTLRRNEVEFEYLPPDEDAMSDLNDNGEHTGEYYPEQEGPVTYRGNISVPSGMTSQEHFGTDIRYTHVLVMDDPEVEISELGLIRWKGELYEIKAVRPSLNAFSAALRKKTVNHAEQETTT